MALSLSKTHPKHQTAACLGPNNNGYSTLITVFSVLGWSSDAAMVRDPPAPAPHTRM